MTQSALPYPPMEPGSQEGNLLPVWERYLYSGIQIIPLRSLYTQVYPINTTVDTTATVDLLGSGVTIALPANWWGVGRQTCFTILVRWAASTTGRLDYIDNGITYSATDTASFMGFVSFYKTCLTVGTSGTARVDVVYSPAVSAALDFSIGVIPLNTTVPSTVSLQLAPVGGGTLYAPVSCPFANLLEI